MAATAAAAEAEAASLPLSPSVYFGAGARGAGPAMGGGGVGVDGGAAAAGVAVAAVAAAAADTPARPEQKNRKRCFTCSKKVRVRGSGVCLSVRLSVCLCFLRGVYESIFDVSCITSAFVCLLSCVWKRCSRCGEKVAVRTHVEPVIDSHLMVYRRPFK